MSRLDDTGRARIVEAMGVAIRQGAGFLESADLDGRLISAFDQQRAQFREILASRGLELGSETVTAALESVADQLAVTAAAVLIEERFDLCSGIVSAASTLLALGRPV